MPLRFSTPLSYFGKGINAVVMESDFRSLRWYLTRERDLG
jgi:hypothetical protein